jgi:hypothetical protein
MLKLGELARIRQNDARCRQPQGANRLVAWNTGVARTQPASRPKEGKVRRRRGEEAASEGGRYNRVAMEGKSRSD